MRFKDNVILRISPDFYAHLIELESARGFLLPDAPELVMTSGNDSIHEGPSRVYDPNKTPPSDSLHYQNRAVDLRSHDLPAEGKAALLDWVRSHLAPSVTMILEAGGTQEEHFHLQFYPK